MYNPNPTTKQTMLRQSTSIMYQDIIIKSFALPTLNARPDLMKNPRLDMQSSRVYPIDPYMLNAYNNISRNRRPSSSLVVIIPNQTTKQVFLLLEQILHLLPPLMLSPECPWYVTPSIPPIRQSPGLCFILHLVVSRRRCAIRSRLAAQLRRLHSRVRWRLHRR